MRPEGAGKGSAFSSDKLAPLMSRATVRRNWIALVGFGVVLAFAWACYAPAISGAFQLDDYVNLAGLSTVDDSASAIDYITSGSAGPTGRPLALASFALQAEQWRQGPAELLRANILIHILNAVLLAVALFQLSLQRSIARYDALRIAIVAAGLWVLMPLLATASLVVVQRMTTLSATFMFLGLNGYLVARDQLNRRPKRALAAMGVSLVSGSVLAAMCKESGLLLPVLVLVLEATVLSAPGGIEHRHWRAWKYVFLVSPLVLLLIYLASWFDYPDATIASRGFNAWERLLTESRVLWIYLAKAVIGNPVRLGVYQYEPAVTRTLSDPWAILACLGWFALTVTALRWRRYMPLYSVAVLWYLAGHLVESTVVPLELYFEHRNYVPIVGPLFALSSFLVLCPIRRHRAARATIAVLALVNAWFLYSFSTLSGHPSIAARYWADVYPASKRAVTQLAMYQLEEEGPLPALQTIESFVSAQPGLAYLRLLELNLLCRYASGQDHDWIIEKLRRDLPNIDYTYTMAWMLFELLDTTSGKACNSIDADTVVSIATIIHNNPRYRNDPIYNRAYWKLLARIAQQRGQYQQEIEHLRRAIDYGASTDINRSMVMALVDSDDIDAARKFIDEAEVIAPANPIMAMRWRRDLDFLRTYVRDAESGTVKPSSAGTGGDKPRQ